MNKKEKDNIAATANEKEGIVDSFFLGHIYDIDDRLVAAKCIEDAIRIYNDFPSKKNKNIMQIKRVTIMEALIQI